LSRARDGGDLDDEEYKTKSIGEYEKALARGHSSPSRLLPADVERESFSDIDDKMAQYRQRKNLPSKVFSGVASSSIDSKSLKAPLSQAKPVRAKDSSQKFSDLKAQK